MKNIIKIIILGIAISLSSCEDDFLVRTPLDDITTENFYKTAQDLETAVNAFYQDLPGWAGVGNGYSQMPDSNTDMITGETPSSGFLGNYSIPTSSSGANWGWWDEVREVNFYLDRVDQAEGNETDINHFIGEGYFFRAYHYFNFLSKYGAVPIIDKYITDKDTEYLFKGRDPRNEVANFIISDLDTAISLLKSFPDISSTPRISKEAAQLFKARVALYEGTWEKYHNGTDFGVAGSDGTEFLEIAADAAEDVIDSEVFSLHDDYGSLFNQIGLKGNSEMILWRDYDYVTLEIGNDLQVSWPNRSSYTRFAIRSYLCTDGKPISVSSDYVGDQDLSTIETNRDPRLAATLMVPGDLVRKDTDGTETYFTAPVITGNNAANGGYESQKYRDPNIEATTGQVTRSTSKILMRYAEVLLIYAEAKAELGTITQTDLDKSINKLRLRPSVNMPIITLGNITADPDWPNYGYSLTDILYEIRRERSVELMAEGFRLDDLYRWRAHSLFDGDTPRGAYFDDGIVNSNTNASEVLLDSEGYLTPFAGDGNYNFDESKAYLSPIPADELILNPNLLPQNPGW
ncbi:RagB/SusD family nutrient uptake outer membrane protein [Neotamlana sedimentorum]|nr:RagB/SusD family nutrient uptake outer membrane protein [Tamlana sedimentorum]